MECQEAVKIFLSNLNNFLTKNLRSGHNKNSFNQEKKMNLLESVSGLVGDAFQTLGSPMFTAASSKAVSALKTTTASVASASSQNFAASAAKAALAFASTSCMIAGLGLAVRSILKNCNIRGQNSIFKAQNLLPKSTGENEKISCSASLVNRMKVVFSKKMIPVAAGLATFTAGMFLLAHSNYFVNAMKK